MEPTAARGAGCSADGRTDTVVDRRGTGHPGRPRFQGPAVRRGRRGPAGSGRPRRAVVTGVDRRDVVRPGGGWQGGPVRHTEAACLVVAGRGLATPHPGEIVAALGHVEERRGLSGRGLVEPAVRQADRRPALRWVADTSAVAPAVNGIEPLVPPTVCRASFTTTGQRGTMSASALTSGTARVGRGLTPFWYAGRRSSWLGPPPPAALWPPGGPAARCPAGPRLPPPMGPQRALDLVGVSLLGSGVLCPAPAGRLDRVRRPERALVAAARRGGAARGVHSMGDAPLLHRAGNRCSSLSWPGPPAFRAARPSRWSTPPGSPAYGSCWPCSSRTASGTRHCSRGSP
ncbi:MAG: hypothetical protein JWO98_4830 [Frankiales bacterium]|nr:hypothetical protein [Frankiales bacterium]